MVQDPILAGLVSAAAQSTNLQLPVTLLSRGVTIEGQLVSEARWLDELANALEQGTAGTAELGAIFRRARMSIEMARAVGDDISPIVHLIAAIIRSGDRVTSAGMWRVRLDAVDGWKLGAALPQHLRAVEG